MHALPTRTPCSERRLSRVCLAAGVASFAIGLASCGDLPSLPIDPDPEPGANEFSGRAALLLATVRGNTYTLADTGSLPPAGGTLETALLDLEIPGLLSAEVAHAAVAGQGELTSAEASLANLDITVEGHHITLEFLIAEAKAQCADGVASVSGESQIATLIVDGEAHVVTAEANQTIDLEVNDTLVGRVVVNEQKPSTDGGTGNMTVNALHIEIFGFADVMIAHAESGIICGEPTSTEDFITGGGFIDVGSGRAYFGVSGGLRDEALFGHLVYKDRGANVKVKATGVTDYIVLNDTTRRIQGTAELNGVGGFTYEVDVTDSGEPGTSDTFAITLSSGYTASGTLRGGNIQLHR